jgi:Fe2+ transport system protein FeoA
LLLVKAWRGSVDLPGERRRQGERRPCPEDIAFEDVVRFLREQGPSSRERVAEEVGERELAEKVIGRLFREELVEEREGRLRLTGRGERIADEIYARHRALEELLRGYVSDAHAAAHFAEHSGIDAGELGKIVGRGAVAPLTSLRVGGEARILAVLDPRPSIVARVFGVGLLPGRRVRVVARAGGLVLLEAGAEARVVALDEDIARKIYVVAEAGSYGPCT